MACKRFSTIVFFIVVVLLTSAQTTKSMREEDRLFISLRYLEGTDTDNHHDLLLEKLSTFHK